MGDVKQSERNSRRLPAALLPRMHRLNGDVQQSSEEPLADLQHIGAQVSNVVRSKRTGRFLYAEATGRLESARGRSASAPLSSLFV